MKISVAQTRPIKEDIYANILSHKKLIDLAISNNADIIFFPELSITGYERELAKGLAINHDDPIFDDFQKISDTNKITIGVGMPTKGNSGMYISMIIFQPQKPRQTYSKQQLHSDELAYYVNGEKQIIFNVEDKQIAPAICYESLQTNHSDNANKLGAEIYIASVAIAQDSFHKTEAHYPAIAKKFSMPVLMSNCIGCDNYRTIGKSSIWTKQGILAGQLDDEHEGILVFDTETEEVIEETIKKYE